jgi:hypothetical protein
MDCMFSADLMVTDTRQTATLLVERLGLPSMKPSWTDPGHSLEDLIYLRAYHPMSSAAPTVLEIIRVNRSGPNRLPAVGGQSEDRPMKRSRCSSKAR